MASRKTAAAVATWRGRRAQLRGPLMVCPTTMMSTMKTASSTRMQHIATATIVCSAWRADRTRPRSALPLRWRSQGWNIDSLALGVTGWPKLQVRSGSCERILKFGSIHIACCECHGFSHAYIKATNFFRRVWKEKDDVMLRVWREGRCQRRCCCEDTTSTRHAGCPEIQSK